MKPEKLGQAKAMSNEPSWAKEHGSAIFIASLLGASVVLLILGMLLAPSDNAFWQALGLFLIQLSGAALAAGIATLFLNFQEVRKYLAATVARLFSEGGIVSILSPDFKRDLSVHLFLDRNKERLQMVEPSLMRHFETLEDRCLSMIHVHNFNAAAGFSKYEEDEELIVGQSATSFLVKAHHLPGAEADFVYRFDQELSVPPGCSLDPSAFLFDYEVRIGSEQFGKDAIQTSSETSGNLPVVRCHFEHRVRFYGEIEVSISNTLLQSTQDPTEVIWARYPTCGFRASLAFTDDLAYDCAWFKDWRPMDAFPGRENVESMANGIAAYTHGWLLPGAGVVLYWFRPTAS